MVRSFALLFLAAAALRGQSWEDLKVLKTEDTIRVTDSNRRSYKGRFIRLSGGGITFRDKDSETELERARVQRVEVKSESRRVRNVLIGAGIGVAVGITIDQTAGKRFGNEGNWDTSDRAISYVAPIALLAGIGALLPHYKTVYRAR